MDNVIKHGFIPDKIEPDQYMFGSKQLSGISLIRDGDWTEWLPKAELQSRPGLETQNCTVYGTLNAIETLLDFRNGEKKNFSDRYVGIVAETTPFGNSPHKVAETIRKVSGVINEDLLPFSSEIESWEDYYSPKPMPTSYKRKGELWLKDWDFGHDWVFRPWDSLKKKQEKMMEALKCSPLGVSVLAWKERNGLFYKNPDEDDTHWCMLYKYELGKKWFVYDHYEKVRKELEWDYNFGFAKRYSLMRKSKMTWWDVISGIFSSRT